MLFLWHLETWEMTVQQVLCLLRNPGDGSNHIFGEYLVNAQGEDVVAGIRTPKVVDSMKDELPNSYKQVNSNLPQIRKTL